MEEKPHKAGNKTHGIQTKQGFDICQTLVDENPNLRFARCFAA